MSHTTMKSLFLGSFIHSKSLDVLEYLHDTAVFVDEKGVIVAIERDCDLKKAEETIYPKLGWTRSDVTVRTAKPGQFFFPGFIGILSSFILRVSADKKKTHTSTPRNSPTPESSAKPPSSTG